MIIPAGEFKAKCLQLMDDVKNRGTRITVTKYGKPVAAVVPVETASRRSLFGILSGTGTIIGDIVCPVDEKWGADE